MTAVVVVEAVALFLLGLLVIGLLRSHAEILRQLHQLGAGREDAAEPTALDIPALRPGLGQARDLSGTTPGDEAVAVGVVGVEHDTLLAFLTSGCLTCDGFWKAFNEGGEAELPEGTRLVAVTKGPGEESPAAVARLAPPDVPVVMSTQAWLDYQVPGSPYFVYVDGSPGRVVGEGTAVTWDQVLSLVGRAVEDRRRPNRAVASRQQEASREARIDEELMAAGIYPGDPRLYPSAEPDQAEQG